MPKNKRTAIEAGQQLVWVEEPVLVPAAEDILRLFFGRVKLLFPGLLAVSPVPSGTGLASDLWCFFLKQGEPAAALLSREDERCRRLFASLEKASGQPAGPLRPSVAQSRQPGGAVTPPGGGRNSEPAACPQEKTAGRSDILLRRRAKVMFYRFCREQTGRSYPWGSLTGIRPTYVAAEILAEVGGRRAEAIARLEHDYDVQTAKAELAVTVAEAEGELLERLPEQAYCLYIGVPFCPSKCHYCSFTLTEGIACSPAVKEAYLSALLKEMAAVLPALKLQPAAVYIGGGTPSEFDAEQISRLLGAIHRFLPSLKEKKVEICFEAGRPDTLNAEKLAAILASGVNRICINPQTMQDATLQSIGRRHTVAETVTAFNLARQIGFRSINMDLIAGLPGETALLFRDSLQQILALEPDSLTVHALAVKRSSRLNEGLMRTAGEGLARFKRTDTEVADMLTMAALEAASAGLRAYYLYRQKDGMGGLENVGFARPGAANLYNVAMMSDRYPVVAFGCGAISKQIAADGRAVRSPNVKSLSAYLQRYAEMAERKRQLFNLSSEG